METHAIKAEGQGIIQVDAFTDRPFAGNPAAVCVLAAAAEERWMQQVAGEMNLSETAYLVARSSDPVDGWDLRWFTPKAEVDLCGHATLASAHVLWDSGLLAPEAEARFHTLSGLLTARRAADGWIAMDFPAQPADRPIDAADAQALMAALGATAVSLLRNRIDVLFEVENEAALRALEPDLKALTSLTRGLIATAPADDPNIDFVSRFFAPAVGVDEDPVTGSAHACLAPYWGAKLGKTQLVGYQASARGGVVRVTPNQDRVTISGQAVTVMRGQLRSQLVV